MIEVFEKRYLVWFGYEWGAS